MIALTADAKSELGFDRHVAKPIQPMELFSAMVEVLGSRRANISDSDSLNPQSRFPEYVGRR